VSKFGKQNAGNEGSSSTSHIDSISDSRVADRRQSVGGAIAVVGGGVLSGIFYTIVYATAWAPLERYFLGHPVAIAATILFCVAISILAVKSWATRRQWRLLRRAADDALAPKSHFDSPAEAFQKRHDAGFVAQAWSGDLARLPGQTRGSQLVVRLREVLMRQSGRGTTKHLADDLRELSSRDADSAHDSFALIRIIVWAIPMLGFLGTVIGITQTLGGLDFSNGTAAVDNLKSGLYVAFDTTALGLVLSIVAIFLQFPVERSESQLLAAIDERVGYLTGLHLPGDEPADNQFELLAHLCEGVRTAVAESLSNQTQLWRETIDEAQGHWQQTHDAQARSIIDAVEGSFAPALRDHAGQLELATERNREQLSLQFEKWQSQLSSWQQTLVSGAEAMTQQQALMLEQVDQAALYREQAASAREQAASVCEQTASVLTLQQTLAQNLDLLHETNRRIDDNMGAAAGQGMADAMIVLARAIDILTHEIVGNHKPSDQQRRAA
jgi:biopolymer transport protein ExbB/TolQ